jgi:hypothetical protein
LLRQWSTIQNYLIKEFAREWNFKHETSSPYWPQSNGMVERHIQTIKRMLKKVDDDGKDPNLALLEYRNTPIDVNISSPNDIMFNRKIRGLIPIRNVNDNSNKVDYKDIRHKLVNRQNEQKKYFDKKAHDSKEEIRVNDKVYVKKDMNKPLQPGRVVAQNDRPRSFKIKLENDNVIDRNTRHIYPYRGNDDSFNSNPVNKSVYLDDDLDVKVDTPEQDLRPIENNVSVRNEQNNVNANHNVQTPNVCTRSGRATRAPAYLKDYDCT